MSLSDEIRDIIYDEVPINAHCPNCDRDVEGDSVLVSYKRASAKDKIQWDRMIAKILQAVINETLDNVVREADETCRDIRKGYSS